jgi:NADH:ubiquinone oxidoreductase subunit E
MGSSCFSRGNSDIAKLVTKFVEDRNLSETVKVEGCLCRGICKNGPNIDINGKIYNHISAETLDETLEKALGLK